jgi:diguanylate cyclase (GGDEF)-like protein/PAS domain S-box-containing protein
MNKSGLLVRLAIVISFAALAVGLISAQLFYQHTYLNEVEVSTKKITQLYQTVNSTASIAAYLEDKQLAREVINGLATNDIVHAASISIASSVISTDIKHQNKPLIFNLDSPFEKDKKVGSLIIVPDLNYIESRAIEIGKDNAKALVAQSIIVTAVAIIISYFLITQPMVLIARALHRITPGTSKRLTTPDFHENSELGYLVDDVNYLLDKTEHQISEERKLRKEIGVLEKRFRMLFENSVSPIILVEPLGNILLHNVAFKSTLEKIGANFKTNFGPLLEGLFENPEQLIKSVQKSLTNDEIGTGEYKLNCKNKDDSVWVQVVVTLIRSDDMKELYQITLHDISKRKKELELLSLRADHDPLTQLFNRKALEHKIINYMDTKTPFAIILLDLDGFKQINDVYGHDAGDEILIHISGQIKRSVRRDDLTCRWGGDEFVLLLKNIEEKDLRELAKKLITRIKKSHYLKKYDKNVSVGASMGAAFFPEDEVNMQSIIHLADQAMYAVKRQSKHDTKLNLLLAKDIIKSTNPNAL